MDVWVGVLAFVLFLGFFVAVLVCVSAIKKQDEIIIRSRLHRKLNNSEIIYSNLGLVIMAVLLYFGVYVFIPAILSFVLFIILSTRVKSGLTRDGAVVGTKFIDWEFMKSYKLVDDENSNIINLKIRADRRQYVLVCERRDKEEIKAMFKEHGVARTKVIGEITK